jgi:hypothetical protein
MHPTQLHILASQHIAELHNQAAQARLAREARRGRRWRRNQPPPAGFEPARHTPSWTPAETTDRRAA